MVGNNIPTPFTVEPVVSDEKLAELLRLQSEYPELDFKATIDLKTPKGKAEFVKDVAAMQVLGGYIIGGVDDDGNPSNGLAGLDPRPFDSASLADIARTYLPDPITILSRWFVDIADDPVVLIYVGPHPNGYAVFKKNGDYSIDGKPQKPVFVAGDIYWRQNSKSVRVSQEGIETIIQRRISAAREVFLAEHEETTRQLIQQLRLGYEAQEIAAGPPGALTIDLPTSTLTTAFLDLARRNDFIPLRHLLREAVARSRTLVAEQDEFEEEIGAILDKLVCLGAVFLDYDLTEWLTSVVAALADIYALGDFRRYDFNAAEKAPRLWLLVITRVYALGGFAARSRQWDAIGLLARQSPEGLGDYYKNWLRHAITMASRARLLGSEDKEGKNVLVLARQLTSGLECLRPDGVDPEDEVLLTALVEFDVLSNLANIADARSIESSVVYPSFGKFRGERVEPIVHRLLVDPEMRKSIFPLEDDDLAVALRAVGDQARYDGFRAPAGFWGWSDAAIVEFLAAHPAPNE